MVKSFDIIAKDIQKHYLENISNDGIDPVYLEHFTQEKVRRCVFILVSIAFVGMATPYLAAALISNWDPMLQLWAEDKSTELYYNNNNILVRYTGLLIFLAIFLVINALMVGYSRRFAYIISSVSNYGLGLGLGCAIALIHDKGMLNIFPAVLGTLLSLLLAAIFYKSKIFRKISAGRLIAVNMFFLFVLLIIKVKLYYTVKDNPILNTFFSTIDIYLPTLILIMVIILARAMERLDELDNTTQAVWVKWKFAHAFVFYPLSIFLFFLRLTSKKH